MSQYKYKMVIEVWCDNEEDLQYINDQAADAVDVVASCADVHMETLFIEEEA